MQETDSEWTAVANLLQAKGVQCFRLRDSGFRGSGLKAWGSRGSGFRVYTDPRKPIFFSHLYEENRIRNPKTVGVLGRVPKPYTLNSKTVGVLGRVWPDASSHCGLQALEPAGSMRRAKSECNSRIV